MGMETTILDQHRSLKLTQAMQFLIAHPKRVPEAWHSATIEAAVGMLVEPVNDDPYVFVLPNTLHTFESIRSSGTDHLRQRIEAGIFFRGLVAQRQAEKQRPEAAETLPSGASTPRARRAAA